MVMEASQPIADLRVSVEDREGDQQPRQEGDIEHGGTGSQLERCDPFQHPGKGDSSITGGDRKIGVKGPRAPDQAVMSSIEPGCPGAGAGCGSVVSPADECERVLKGVPSACCPSLALMPNGPSLGCAGSICFFA